MLPIKICRGVFLYLYIVLYPILSYPIVYFILFCVCMMITFPRTKLISSIGVFSQFYRDRDDYWIILQDKSGRETGVGGGETVSAVTCPLLSTALDSGQQSALGAGWAVLCIWLAGWLTGQTQLQLGLHVLNSQYRLPCLQHVAVVTTAQSRITTSHHTQEGGAEQHSGP